MKRSGKRLLAVLLCLAMAMTLLPVAALARWDDAPTPEVPAEQDALAAVKAELPVNAEGDDKKAELSAGTALGNGIQNDIWSQDPATVINNTSSQNDAVVEKTNDGRVHLLAGTRNGNSHGTSAGSGGDSSWPAVFVNETANAALATTADKGEDRWIEVTYVRAESSAPRFGVILNYNSPTDGFFIGSNTDDSGFFTEEYKTDGTSVWSGLPSGGTTPAAGVETTLRIEWNDTKLIRVAQNGTDIITNYTFNRGSAYTGTGVGFRMNAFSSDTTGPAEVYIKKMHYSGQATVTTYDVTGTVKDEKNAALAGVTVTANPGNHTATTGSDGVYTIADLTEGTYTLSFAKTGYKVDPVSVTVSNANVTKNITMAETDMVEIQTDGVNENWIKKQAGSQTGVTAEDPEVEDGRLVLLSGSGDGSSGSDKHNKLPDGPAIYTSTDMDTHLAAVDGKKWISFELTPECVADLGVPEYLGFGITLNYNGQTGSDAKGYFIGFATADDGLFSQEYNAATAPWDNFTLPDGLASGKAMKFYIEWTDTSILMKVNDKTITMPHNNALTGDTSNSVAFSVSGKGYSGDELQNKTRQTKLTISNLHYSGQETIPARYVKGTVKCAGKAVEGATVSVAGDSVDAYTQITDAQGKYTVALPIKDTSYTLNATKDGFTTDTKTVSVTEDANKATLEAVDFTLVEMPTIKGVVKDKLGNGVRATVTSDKRPEGKSVVCDGTGAFTIVGAVDGGHTLSITAEGYEPKEVKVTVNGANVTITPDIVLEDRKIPSFTLATEDMEVQVAQGFPQVIGYKLLKLLDKDGNPKTMHGQTAELDTILINNIAVKPTVTSVLDEATNKKVTYTMVIDSTNNATTGVTATITAELRVGLDDLNDSSSEAAGRTLGFFITGVEYAGADAAAKAANRLAHPVETIEIPNHSLVSVRSTETGAAVIGGKQAANTTVSGDTSYVAAESAGLVGRSDSFFAAFIYNDQLSAGLASNSAYGPDSAGSASYPVRATFEAKDGGTTTAIGLDSVRWYYDVKTSNHEHAADQKITTALTDEQKVVAPRLEEMPYAKVVIAGDVNESGKVDWQDSAIALRETVMHVPAGGETVANSVNLRISMNFGSMAANPFLIALDNVKRVAAHTDGLGQFVLLKGYAGEGHDSNHPQYSNIGVRMGGAEDMLTLMTEGEKLGATFGIHTNASEFYAEAIDDQAQVRRNTDGSLHYGWNWLDQGIAINGVYDFASGLRADRWDELFDIVKGHPFVVYVDVWGNNTSGTEDDWMTRKLANEIVSHEDWRLAHEWAWANPYESTFQHWTTDFIYGTYSDKGKLNSSVIRFMLNQYKDSFVPDFASYGGAANAPLLGGPAMQGFEGWQGDGEYDLSIYNTYNEMVYTKFLQHYPVVEWTNADTAAAIPYNGGAAGASRNNDTVSQWKPETQLRLSDGKDEIVVTRGTTGTPLTDAQVTAKFGTLEKFLANETEYRSRVVTLNGKVIVTGAPASAGEDNTFPKGKATLKYLIPWYWGTDGNKVTADNEKLYHWNAQGGTSTWELPKGWESLENVVVYELSDQGRGTGKTVKVIGGKVTLSGIAANTGYVVTKGADKGTMPEIKYGTGLHLEDPSFNINTDKGPWTVEGKGSAVHTVNPEGISVLKMVGEVSVSQEMNSLDAGQNYVTYVAVDNRSNTAEARITITDDTGKVVATNYTARSIARNYISSYYLHNGHGVEAGGSYFQNMYLYFTPVAGRKYTLTLSRTAGSGNIYFDDIRTVEFRGATLPVTYGTDNEGNATSTIASLNQDFENVPQGIWPMVVGPVEQVADNRQHLSQLNAPFTQAGWDVKKLDDVIDGEWSVKVNGKAGAQNLVMQTIPQTFRFEPNSVYTVEFDYELGSVGSYVAVVGDGAYTGLDGLTVVNLEQTLSTTVPNNSGVAGNTTAQARVGHAKFTVVGSESGQTWVGIYSKDNANNQGTSGSAAAFGGYLDFVLDNLTITLAPGDKNELAKKLREADAMVEAVYVAKDNPDNTAAAWSTFTSARTSGHTVFDNERATTQQISDALTDLDNAMKALEKVAVSISGTVTNVNGAPVEGVELTLEDEHYMPVGLTLTTGADGTYKFETKSGVELVPATYHVKAQATGYNVTTTEAIVATKADGVKTANISLEAEAPGAYVNDFNTGDISMMGHLEPPEDTEVDDDLWPELEAVEYNGSGALKVTFRGNNSAAGVLDCRNISNVVDKTMPFANGSFSFDVTALTDGVRFGITLRGTEMNNRVCIGQQDTVGQWMGEFWQGLNGSNWTRNTTGKISVDAGATRNVRVVANDTHFTVYIDGDEVYNVDLVQQTGDTGGARDVQTNAGFAGINMRYHSGSEFIIDNIRIVSADDAGANTHDISGSVTAGSTAVAGAAVALEDRAGNRVDGTSTNALGQYAIKNVDPGSYVMKVSAPFYNETSKNITVGSSDLTGQDFTLTVDKSSLIALIDEMEALDEEKYTEETWEPLAEALTAAEAVEADNSATVAALNTAYKNLSNAKDALEEKPVELDFSGLRAVYNKQAGVENPDGKYTNDSWADFQEALDAAYSTLLNGNVVQADIEKAKTDLETAAAALVEITPEDKEGIATALEDLQAAYDEAVGVEQGSYTDASWATFDEARTAALAILSNSDGLTQAQVDAATAALKAAKSGLRTPGSSGSSASAATTTTTTETRDDGAKVTTVTQPDGTVTETVEQADGTKSESVTTPAGDVTITVTDAEGEELVKVEIPAEIPAPETEFEDLAVTPWAEESINKVAGLGLVNGIGGNKYDPATPMTRGSLATVLHRLSQGKTDYTATFTDVAEGKYYTEGVAWAAKVNVVKGITEDIFAPDQIITREQLAVMLARYAKLIGLDTKTDAKALETFTDGETTGDWAVDGVAWCVEKGILKGKGLNNLDPTANVSRAEVAVMMDRFIALIQK